VFTDLQPICIIRMLQYVTQILLPKIYHRQMRAPMKKTTVYCDLPASSIPPKKKATNLTDIILYRDAQRGVNRVANPCPNVAMANIIS